LPSPVEPTLGQTVIIVVSAGASIGCERSWVLVV
jgi:hypothetical protein